MGQKARRPQWLAQSATGYSCCLPIAALNALRFYGRSSDVEPGYPGWEQWVDRWGCRHGAATGHEGMLRELGLRGVPMPGTLKAVREALGLGLPVLLNLTHSSSYVGLHSALAVAVDGDRLLVINPHGARGPGEKWLPWSSLTFPAAAQDPAMRNQALVLANGSMAVAGPVRDYYQRMREYLVQPGVRRYPEVPVCQPPADRLFFWQLPGNQNRAAIRAAIPPNKRTVWIAIDAAFRLFADHAPHLPGSEHDILDAVSKWADGEKAAVNASRAQRVYIPDDFTTRVRWVNAVNALKSAAILIAEQPVTLRRLTAAAGDIIWHLVLALVRRPEGYPQPSPDEAREATAHWLACWEQRLHERLPFVVPATGDVVRGVPVDALAYHGGTYRGGSFRGPVLYLATTPEMAESYVEMHGDEGAGLRQFRVRLRNPAPKPVVFEAAERAGIDPSTYTPASVFDAALQGDEDVAALVADLRGHGYDGAILEDIAYGAEIAEPVYVVFDWRAVEAAGDGGVSGPSPILYLANPDPAEWEPAIVGLAGKPLKVTRVDGDKVTVADPDNSREVMTFHRSELGETRVRRGDVQARYEARAAEANVDPGEGDLPRDEAAARDLAHYVGAWQAFSDSTAKLNAVRMLRAYPELRLNSLRRLYSELKEEGLASAGFDAFLTTPIKVYRGSGLTKDDPVSVSWDWNRIKIFGYGRSALVRPVDMVYYVGDGEREIWIPSALLWGEKTTRGAPQHQRRARINRELQSAAPAVRAQVRELALVLGDERGGATLEAIAGARDAGAPDLASAVATALREAQGRNAVPVHDIKDVILAEALRLRPPGRLVHVIELAGNLKAQGYTGAQIKAALHELAMAGRIEMHPWTTGVRDVPHLDAFPHFGHGAMGRPHYQGYFTVPQT